MTQPDTYRIDEPETSHTAGSHGGSAVFAARDRRVPEDPIATSTANRSSNVPSMDPADVVPTNRHAMDDALLAAKMEALAEFAAGAGHEINNPLAAISGRAQMLLNGETDPERRRHLLTIGAQALRIRDMIGDVMLFARPPIPHPLRVNLSHHIDEVLSALEDDLASSQLTVDRSEDGDLFVHADETQLKIVLSELIRNALFFSPSGSAIRIEAIQRVTGFATIRILDDGPGLSATDREHLFDPFFSGRQAGRGLGFGLSKCWRIVTLHGGDIQPIEGAKFGIAVDWPTTRPADVGADQSLRSTNSDSASKLR